MKKCNKVMTKNPICCLPGDSALKAAELMKSQHIGLIPVVADEQNQKLLGIVTDRDLTMKVVAEGLDARSTKVETVMTHKVITCFAEDDLQKALDAMAQHQLRRIPIVDDNNMLLGIISQADMVTRVNHPKKATAMIKQISEPTTN